MLKRTVSLHKRNDSLRPMVYRHLLRAAAACDEHPLRKAFFVLPQPTMWCSEERAWCPMSDSTALSPVEKPVCERVFGDAPFYVPAEWREKSRATPERSQSAVEAVRHMYRSPGALSVSDGFALLRRLQLVSDVDRKHALADFGAAAEAFGTTAKKLKVAPSASLRASRSAGAELLVAHPARVDKARGTVCMLVPPAAVEGEAGDEVFALDLDRPAGCSADSLIPIKGKRHVIRRLRSALSSLPVAIGGPSPSAPILVHSSSALRKSLHKSHTALRGTGCWSVPLAALGDAPLDVLSSIHEGNATVVMHHRSWDHRGRFEGELEQNWWMRATVTNRSDAADVMHSLDGDLWQHVLSSAGGEAADFARLPPFDADEESDPFDETTEFAEALMSQMDGEAMQAMVEAVDRDAILSWQLLERQQP